MFRFEKAVYLATVETTAVRYRQFPAGAAGVAVADDAAWDQIVASTIITTENWFCAANVGYPAAGLGGDFEEVLAIGIGGADGAAVAAATLLAEFDLLGTQTTAAGEFIAPPIWLPVPIRVAASTRYAASISTSATGGAALSVGITVMTGLRG